ncbi:MAG: Gfo/Idh/MocA family oxidoreductase [bacterium]|nr:Gfo/Idh/MocA family oxidoreductase [bacterium]
MKYLIAGCGSMGKRRARCLRKMGITDIIGTDLREDRMAEIAEQSGVDTVTSLEEGLAAAPDFALICLPPHTHRDCLLACIEAGVPAFCEAPSVMTLEEMDDVMAAAEAKGVFVAPSCTYLHNPIHREAKRFVDESPLGRLLGYMSHAGQHVADWHPYEAYTGFYASKRSEGGMCFDMLPHEFAMLTWMAGDVSALSCMARRRTVDIDTDEAACDVYDVTLDLASGVSAVVHHDMFQRPPGVLRKLMFERGVVEFDWRSFRWAEYGGPNFTGAPEWHNDPLEGYDFEQMYVDELAHAVAASRGEETYLLPLAKEREILGLMLACEKSSEQGIHIRF